jgi:hypothetical protein
MATITFTFYGLTVKILCSAMKLKIQKIGRSGKMGGRQKIEDICLGGYIHTK